jgi:hypothetical protein
MWDTSAISSDCPKYVNNYPLGENSPNLVTLPHIKTNILLDILKYVKAQFK